MKHLLVTGGGRGIGYETVTCLARLGHRVITVARTEKELSRLKKSFPDLISTVTADLSQPNGCKRLAEFVLKLNSKLDGVLHNAGALINKPFEELTDEEWSLLVNIHLMAPVRLNRQLIPAMNRGSHMLHISSMGGYQMSAKYPGLSAYSTTKGALAILSETLAVELADHGIRSNCLCLGAVGTDMLKKAFPGFKAPVTAAEMGNYLAGFLLNGHQLYNGRILPVTLSDPG